MKLERLELFEFFWSTFTITANSVLRYFIKAIGKRADVYEQHSIEVLRETLAMNGTSSIILHWAIEDDVFSSLFLKTNVSSKKFMTRMSVGLLCLKLHKKAFQYLIDDTKLKNLLVWTPKLFNWTKFVATCSLYQSLTFYAIKIFWFLKKVSCFMFLSSRSNTPKINKSFRVNTSSLKMNIEEPLHIVFCAMLGCLRSYVLSWWPPLYEIG